MPAMPAMPSYTPPMTTAPMSYAPPMPTSYAVARVEISESGTCTLEAVVTQSAVTQSVSESDWSKICAVPG